MFMCPKCNKVLKIIADKFLECSCGYDKSIKDYNAEQDILKKQNQHWLTNIYEDESLWCKDIFETDFPIISHEYKRLYSLCKEKQSYGMLLEIKDIFEILIKFPSLLVASNIYMKNKNDGYSNDETMLLKVMLEKQLSLGTWEELSKTALEISENENLKSWLFDIREKFKETKKYKGITNWRNSEIGHGALSLDESKEFQNDIKEKIQRLKEFFDKNIKTLQDIFISDEFKKSINTIFFKKDENNHIYFFDSYGYNKTSRVDYINGRLSKKYENEINNLASKLEIDTKNNILDNCAESKTRDALAQKIFENLQKVNDYIKPTYLEKWISNNLKNNTKGTFLLQMQRGMGKSMFTRSLDELSLSKIEFDNTMIRAYYINDVYSNTLEDFTSVLDDTILNKYISENKLEDKIVGVKPEKLNTASNSKDFVNMLNEYKNQYNQDKLLFIIDGADEILDVDKKGILDIIPSHDELLDGIYIIVTSRLKISDNLQSKLDDINFNNIKKVKLDDKEYEENIKSYISSKIFKNKQSKKEILDSIYARTDKRFIYIKLVKILIDMGIELKDILNTKELVKTYLDNIKQRYGDKFFQNILDLLAVISTAYEKLTLKEIAYMLNKECIDFKLLALLNDTKGFLRFDRSYRGNLVSIEHKDIKDILVEYKDIEKSSKDIVLKLIDNITDEKHEIDIENNGESYLLANIDSLYNINNMDYIVYKKIFDKIEDYSENKNKVLIYRSIKILKIIYYYCKNNKDDKKVVPPLYLLSIFYSNNNMTNKEIDLLNQIISLRETIKEPDEKLKKIISWSFIGRAIYYIGLDSNELAKYDIEQALSISQELKLSDQIPICYGYLGIIYSALKDINKSKENYKKSILLLKESIDFNTSLLDNILVVFTNYIIFKNSIGDFKETFTDYSNIMDFIKENSNYISNETLAIVYMHKSTTYFILGKNKEALREIKKSFEIYKEFSNNDSIEYNKEGYISILKFMSLIYSSNKNKKESIFYINKAIFIAREEENNKNKYINPNTIVELYRYKAIILFDNQQYEESLEEINLAFLYIEKFENNELLLKLYLQKGLCDSRLEKYNELELDVVAIDYLKKECNINIFNIQELNSLHLTNQYLELKVKILWNKEEKIINQSDPDALEKIVRNNKELPQLINNKLNKDLILASKDVLKHNFNFFIKFKTMNRLKELLRSIKLFSLSTSLLSLIYFLYFLNITFLIPAIKLIHTKKINIMIKIIVFTIISIVSWIPVYYLCIYLYGFIK